MLAPKHASHGDGFSIYGEVDDLAFVTGDHLERFPLSRRAEQARRHRRQELRRVRRAPVAEPERGGGRGRGILIYPEGHLAPVGFHHPYRSGVWRMARDFDLPVVPVASSLGLFWPQQAWRKRPGRAVLEFLDPIAPGPDKQAFLAELETAVETRTAELIAEARGGPVQPSVCAEPPPPRARPSPRPLREREGPALGTSVGG